jgi:hypothetical protein
MSIGCWFYKVKRKENTNTKQTKILAEAALVCEALFLYD